MRIVIDLEDLQRANFNCSFLQTQLNFLKNILHESKQHSHQFILLFNGQLLENSLLIQNFFALPSTSFSNLQLQESKPQDLLSVQYRHWFPTQVTHTSASITEFQIKSNLLIKQAVVESLEPNLFIIPLFVPLLDQDSNVYLVDFLNQRKAENGNTRAYISAVLYHPDFSRQNRSRDALALDHDLSSYSYANPKEHKTLCAVDFIFCLSPPFIDNSSFTSLGIQPSRCIALYDHLNACDSHRTYNSSNSLRVTEYFFNALAAIQHQEQSQLKARTTTPFTLYSKQQKRLAYVSPLPPLQSGIANYSEELLKVLSRHYDIDVIVNQDAVSSDWINSNLVVANTEWLKAHSHCYDHVLYHFGNSGHFHAHMLELLEKVPGVVVLHDFFLSGLLSTLDHNVQKQNGWNVALYHSHGYVALIDRFLSQQPEDANWKWPCNLKVLQSAKSVIVHSLYARQLANHFYPAVQANQIHVCPLLREPALQPASHKNLARNRLGFQPNDFIVCSFGFVSPTKLHHQLLQSWIQSSLATDTHCYLIFVGDYPDAAYEKHLTSILETTTNHQRIKTTGWVDQKTYCDYLLAADLGVQLRTLSRGETSAAVLDCMNYGLATIVNANGSMADLDSQAVWKLNDTFSINELTHALELLHQNSSFRNQLATYARNLVFEKHSPEQCASFYQQVLESTRKSPQEQIVKLTHEISEFAYQINEIDAPIMKALAFSIDRSFPIKWQCKQILVDVSNLQETGLETGIQRVVKAVLKQWLHHPPHGFRVEPVYALSTQKGYYYARKFSLNLLQCPNQLLQDAPINFQQGDYFLALDFAMDIIVQQKDYLQELKTAGVTVKFVVYDLLPLQMPHHFLDFVVELFDDWLKVVSESNGAICISKTVANDLTDYLQSLAVATETSALPPVATALPIDWFHLGADLKNSFNSLGMSARDHQLVQTLQNQITFLMVGTLESRKGHQQVLDAFHILCKSNTKVHLVLIGKQGWKVEGLIQQIQNSPLLHKRLFWLQDTSDELLEKIYQASSCLIAASYGEGFGLPLIEAAQYGVPIMARNISIYQEVASKHAYFFNAASADDLANEIATWIELYKLDQHPKSDGIAWQTWEESAQQLCKLMSKQPDIF